MTVTNTMNVQVSREHSTALDKELSRSGQKWEKVSSDRLGEITVYLVHINQPRTEMLIWGEDFGVRSSHMVAYDHIKREIVGRSPYFPFRDPDEYGFDNPVNKLTSVEICGYSRSLILVSVGYDDGREKRRERFALKY